MTELKFQGASGLLKGLAAVSHFTCSAPVIICSCPVLLPLLKGSCCSCSNLAQPIENSTGSRERFIQWAKGFCDELIFLLSLQETDNDLICSELQNKEREESAYLIFVWFSSVNKSNCICAEMQVVSSDRRTQSFR